MFVLLMLNKLVASVIDCLESFVFMLVCSIKIQIKLTRKILTPLMFAYPIKPCMYSFSILEYVIKFNVSI